MKTHNKIPKQVEEQWAVTKVTCDCCKAELKAPDGKGITDNNWSKSHDITERASLSTSKFAYGDTEFDEIDICYECGQWLINNILSKKIQRRPVEAFVEESK